MNRRTFFARMATGIAAAALATHLTFGKLVPVLEPVVEPKLELVAGVDYYVIKWPVENGMGIWTGYHVSPEFGKYYAALKPRDKLDLGFPVEQMNQELGSPEARHEIYDKLMGLPRDETTSCAWRALGDPRKARFQWKAE